MPQPPCSFAASHATETSGAAVQTPGGVSTLKIVVTSVGGVRSTSKVRHGDHAPTTSHRTARTRQNHVPAALIGSWATFESTVSVLPWRHV